MTIISAITRQMLFVIKWDTPVIGDGLVVISGPSNQRFKLRWMMSYAVVGSGVLVHLNLQTIVVTAKMCSFNVMDSVRKKTITENETNVLKNNFLMSFMTIINKTFKLSDTVL